MHGVKNSSWNPTLFVLPNKNLDLRMREREILRRRGLMKSHIQTYALCLMLLSLSVPLFCFLFMSLLCMYLLSFCVSAFFFLSSFFFFSFICPPSIYRDSKGVVLLFFSQLIRSWNNFRQFFLHNSLFHVEPWPTIQLFALFICSVCFLNSLFLVCDIPTFRFSVPLSWNLALYFQVLALPIYFSFLFYLISFYLLLFVLGSRLWTWLILLLYFFFFFYIFFFVVFVRCRPYMTTLFWTYAIVKS